MLYIYDILVNFMDGNEVYESFEWEYKDVIENVKKIPVIKVSNEVFYDFIFNDVVVSHEFLDTIKGRTSTYKEKIDFACLITNSERCFAIEFNKEGKILFKSSLLLDEEDDVLSCSMKLPVSTIDYKVLKVNEIRMRCLTRKEEKDLHLLKREIDTAYEYKDYEKLVYLYNEVYPEDEKDIHDKYKRLKYDLDSNFCKIKKLVKIISLINKK